MASSATEESRSERRLCLIGELSETRIFLCLHSFLSLAGGASRRPFCVYQDLGVPVEAIDAEATNLSTASRFLLSTPDLARSDSRMAKSDI